MDEGGLGIRAMKESNTTILAKLGWRLMTKPDSLWARILRGKYYDNKADIDMIRPLTRALRIRRGINQGASLLSKGTRISIGNGSQTLFWSHR